MKQPKKLTRTQKEILTKAGKDPAKFTCIRNDDKEFYVMEKIPGEGGKQEMLVFSYR